MAGKNGWGEDKGLQKLNTIENKKHFEADFQNWTQSSDKNKTKYAGLLPLFEKIYKAQYDTRKSYKYFTEACLGSEIISFAYSYNKLLLLSKNKNPDDKEIEKTITQLKNAAIGFFKNYNINIDKELFIQTMKAYYESFDKGNVPDVLKLVSTKFKGDSKKFAENVFNNTIFTSNDRINKLLSTYTTKNYKQISKDPAFVLAQGLFDNYYNKIYPFLTKYKDQLDSLNRIYLQGLMEMQKNKTFYPDANLTLRVTYGKVDDYIPKDAVKYRYFTTLDGIFEKETLGNEDYMVHPKLRVLYKNKDFGRYAKNDTIPICFIASNHTTGGNSGSPVLNAEGQLIGINFDRNWEGTMSDLNYDPDQCRNISLDIRYVLFIIDKFAGAKNLINEIEIVN